MIYNIMIWPPDLGWGNRWAATRGTEGQEVLYRVLRCCIRTLWVNLVRELGEHEAHIRSIKLARISILA